MPSFVNGMPEGKDSVQLTETVVKLESYGNEIHLWI